MVFHQIWVSFEGVFSDGIQDDIDARAICLVIDDAFVAILLVVNNPVCSKALYEFDAPDAEVARRRPGGSGKLDSDGPDTAGRGMYQDRSPTCKRARSIRHP